MIFNREQGYLLMQEINGRSGVGASDQAERLVLDLLKDLEGGRREIRIDDWSRIVEKWTDDFFVGEYQTFLILAKGSV